MDVSKDDLRQLKSDLSHTFEDRLKFGQDITLQEIRNVENRLKQEIVRAKDEILRNLGS